MIFMKYQSLAIYSILSIIILSSHSYAIDNCGSYIQNNDFIVLMGVCYDTSLGYVGRAMCYTKFPGSIFKIMKSPYYPSHCNAIVLGKSATMIAVESMKVCSLDNNLIYTCNLNYTNSINKLSIKNITPIRILDKHGQNSINMRNIHYIKFRPVGISRDCNDGGIYFNKNTKLTCNTSSNINKYYGFIISKVSYNTSMNHWNT